MLPMLLGDLRKRASVWKRKCSKSFRTSREEDQQLLRYDEWMGVAIVFGIVIMAPAQLYLFDVLVRSTTLTMPSLSMPAAVARLRSCPPGPFYLEIEFVLPRVFQALTVIATTSLLRRLPGKRVLLQAASFALVWLAHLYFNLRVLYLSARNPMVSGMMVASCTSFTLCFHVALPVYPDNIAMDIAAHLVVLIVHAGASLLVVPLDEACWFIFILAVTSIVPVTLRLLWFARRCLDMNAETSRARAAATRMINHSSKRVMLNVINGVDLIVEQLEHERQGAATACDTMLTGHDVSALLRTIRADALTGYQMCESNIMAMHIAAGDYALKLVSCTVAELFKEAGLNYRPRVHTAAAGTSCAMLDAPIRADVRVLRTVLCESVQNALQHGRVDGPVNVFARIEAADERGEPSGCDFGCVGGDSVAAGWLRMRVRNDAGPKHARLLALLGDVGTDLIRARPSPRELQQAKVGAAVSTFVGLSDLVMCASAVNARVSLWPTANEVEFELLCPIEIGPSRSKSPPNEAGTSFTSRSSESSETSALSAAPHTVVESSAATVLSAPGSARAMLEPAEPPATATAPAPAPPSAAALATAELIEPPVQAPSLPGGLAFLCMDDDMISRIVLETLLSRVHACSARSRVLGETYTEATGFTALVGTLAAELGDDHVVVVLDQYMDYDEGTLLGTDLRVDLLTLERVQGV